MLLSDLSRHHAENGFETRCLHPRGWPHSLLAMQIAVQRRDDRFTHRSNLSRYRRFPKLPRLFKARKQLALKKLVQQDRIAAQCTYWMNRSGDMELMLNVPLDIRDGAMEVSIGKQVRLAQQNQSGNTRLVKQP